MLTKGLRNALDEAYLYEVTVGGFPMCYRKAAMRKLHDLGVVRAVASKTSRGNDTSVWVLTPAGVKALDKE